jgi:hypothetical protein
LTVRRRDAIVVVVESSAQVISSALAHDIDSNVNRMDGMVHITIVEAVARSRHRAGRGN